MRKDDLYKFLDKTYTGFPREKVPNGVSFYKGKVRDVFDLGSELLISTSDRISAYDCVLGSIPCKGELLNSIASYWFGCTSDIISNHMLEEVTKRSIRVKACDVLPIEVIVRGYLTGSAWRDYKKQGAVSGIVLPGAMKKNQQFLQALITPSSKAEQGFHDEPVSREQILAQKLVDRDVYEEIEQKALALFQRGTELAKKQGLILVDTKYEFGLYNGKLLLVDEIHTPDSSRYWYADTYQACFDKQQEQKQLDKEFFRHWLTEQGFQGDGQAPVVPDDILVETAWRYIIAYERICGKEFSTDMLPVKAEQEKILSYLIERRR